MNTEGSSDTAEEGKALRKEATCNPHLDSEEVAKTVEKESEEAKTEDEAIDATREERGCNTATKHGLYGKPSVRLGPLERRNIKLHSEKTGALRFARGKEAATCKIKKGRKHHGREDNLEREPTLR